MYNVRDIDWMLKSMSIHQRDNKGIVKFKFLTSCLTFMGSILTVIRSFEFDKIKVAVDALEETCGDAAFGDKAKSIGESYESSIVCGVTIDVSLFNGHFSNMPLQEGALIGDTNEINWWKVMNGKGFMRASTSWSLDRIWDTVKDP